MQSTINIFVGFDQREAVAYHVFCQSVIEKSSCPLRFTPLAENTLSGYQETHKDGSNRFIYSRFLTPYFNGFDGWALFADGDMICQSDLKDLWDLRDETKAVQVVKHEYKTKRTTKYLGNKNENYPRKNWSSIILWNCAHPINRILTPDFISSKEGSYLHRFSWIPDPLIGELPTEWNWLALEFDDNPNARIVHYTLGTPCFEEYQETSMSSCWHDAYTRLNEGFDK